MKLEGRSAIVSGGGSGIGRGIALELARAGASGPDFAQLRYHLGVVYHESNQPDSARAELEKAVVEGAKYPELEKARTLLATLN